ncbi:uncharacterized protein TNCV_1559391 [Trichonephila clavipes]|nr:uncharacterized protein TNCV_1559391 [Trichonephila clavipes]
MHKNSNLLEQEDLKKLEENDLIDKVAFILRSTVLKMDKTTLPAVMKMEDLINAECNIPEKLDHFFKSLIGGKDIRHRDGVNFIEDIDSHSSMPIELPNNILSRVLSAYQKFVEETRQDNLNKVDETHPGLKNDFMNGCFGIKRTDKPFSSIPIDLTLDQTINAEAARCLSGIAHFTNSLAARQRWTKSHSIRAIIISHVLDVCVLKQLQDVPADLQPNRIKIYGKQFSSFNEIFENNINPFDESLDKNSLYDIATAKPVPENVANFLLNIEKNGEDLRKQLITECAKDQNRFYKPIKKPSA